VGRTHMRLTDFNIFGATLHRDTLNRIYTSQ
jgi:hypothetical protein